MTVQITPDLIAKVFGELPGSTRQEKAAAITSLVRGLRTECEAFHPRPRNTNTLASIRDQLVGAKLSELANKNVDVGGLSLPVTALGAAFLSPGHVLHDTAKRLFAEVNLTVVVEKSAVGATLDGSSPRCLPRLRPSSGSIRTR